MNIKENRLQVSDAPALYLVEPTKENIDIICSDCEKNLYDSFYLNFIYTIPRDILEYLATKLVEIGASDKVHRIYDQFLNFICAEKSFFTLDQSIFIDLFSKQEQDMKILDPIVSGLISVILTLEVIPIISYKPGTFSETVAKRVDQKLRNLLLDRSHLKQFNIEYSKKRPILILVDRDIDYSVMIQHKWSYRSLCHDLFSMKQNSVKVEIKKEEELSLPTYKTYDIDIEDEFWAKNAGLAFQDFAETLETSMKNYTKKIQEFNEKTGLKIEEDSLLGEDAVNNLNKNDKPLSKTIIDDVLHLIDGKKGLNTHVNISYAILKEVKTRKIDQLVSIQECLIENRKFDKKVLQSFIKEYDKGTAEDKIRLFLICYLSKILHGTPSSFSKQEYDDLLNEFERTIKELTGSYSIPQLVALKSICKNVETTKEVESNNLLIDIIGNNLKLFGQSIMMPPQSETLPLTKIVSNLMDQKKDKDVEKFIYLDPKGSTKPSTSFDEFTESIVFVIGPGNYFEYQNLLDYSIKESKSIQYGCVKIQTGIEFINDLQALGERLTKK